MFRIVQNSTCSTQIVDFVCLRENEICVVFILCVTEMDVRQSLNADDNCSVITGDGQLSFIENDSFFARAPPQAASTVCRTKAR